MEGNTQNSLTCKYCGRTGEDVSLHTLCDKEWVGCDDDSACMERMNVALKKKREQEVALAELIRVRKALNPPTGVYSPGTTGAIKEYEVVIDLLSKGYDVYRSCSPNSSCDLVATKGPRTIRLEVAIGYYAGKDGRYTYNRHQGSSDFFDIIAVVLHDKIVYLAKGEATFTETQL